MMASRQHVQAHHPSVPSLRFLQKGFWSAPSFGAVARLVTLEILFERKASGTATEDQGPMTCYRSGEPRIKYLKKQQTDSNISK